ncbi:MFS transporter [Pseudoroseomonas cervicalis]|uniref:MFS transporter n=1 Tax=Teichococcus cervicalis TaxID=204525 RepID=UPI00277D911B|nr:MFS transporter [Pseudoroseomonas cervicalis]MDQ1081202.1 putative MFS family arabinose efflux permease [Pseudoroseomonas cervicalis]
MIDETRRLVLVFGLGGFAGALAGRALDPLMGELASEFHTPHAQVALLASAFTLPYALVQPVLGPMGDAFGKRRVIGLCLAALALMLAACALAPGLDSLFAARIAAGLAAGGIFPLTLALFGDRVAMAQRQLAISRFLACAILGQLAGGAVSGLVSPWIGWRGVMGICALMAALSAAVVALDARRTPGTAPPGRLPGLAEVLRRYGGILRNRAAQPLFIGVLLEGMLVFGPFPFFSELLGSDGHGTRNAGLAVAGFGLGGFGYTLLAPLLLRRLGQARMMRLAGACVLAGLASLAAAASDPRIGIAGALLIGLGFFMLHNSIQTRVTEVAPGARGSAVALHAFCYFLGQAVGPALFGLGQASAGTGPALLGSGLGVLAIAFWLSRRRAG